MFSSCCTVCSPRAGGRALAIFFCVYMAAAYNWLSGGTYTLPLGCGPRLLITAHSHFGERSLGGKGRTRKLSYEVTLVVAVGSHGTVSMTSPSTGREPRQRRAHLPQRPPISTNGKGIPHSSLDPGLHAPNGCQTTWFYVQLLCATLGLKYLMLWLQTEALETCP